jgi:hypothetical protein
MNPHRILAAAAVLLLATTVTLAAHPRAAQAESLAAERDFLPVFTDEFWNWYPFFPGNGNLQVYTGSSTQAEEELSFSFADGSVFPPPPSSGSGPPDEDFGLIAQVYENEILDPQGNLLCYADFVPAERTFFLYNHYSGAVLFTLLYPGTPPSPPFIFDGEVQPPKTGREFADLIEEGRLRYTIHRTQVFEGLWPLADPLATANENIQLANPMRHLVIAAMLAGKCGSTGLPGF